MLKNCRTRYRNLEDFNEEFRDAKEPDQMRHGNPSPLSSSQPLTCNTPANSKLADILYSKALQKHFDTKDVPVTVLAADPGWVLTEGVRAVPAFSTPMGLPLDVCQQAHDSQSGAACAGSEPFTTLHRTPARISMSRYTAERAL